MKYNLRNRPVKASPQAYERWIKGLERELREILEIYPECNPQWLIHELLGEESLTGEVSNEKKEHQ